MPPTTNSPKLDIISLTASGPKCPLLKIIRVVAIFKDSLKSVMISTKVGKVLRSVGRGMYIEIKIISTEMDIEIARKKSRTADGNGTIITTKIVIITPTMLSPLNFIKGAKYGKTSAKYLSHFAKLPLYNVA